MTEEHKELLTDFIEYERLRGFKSIRKIRYLLKVFFEYLECGGIDLYRLKHRDAQNYQTYLTTLTNEDGSIHYAITTITDMISVTRNLYNYLKFKHLVYSNPFTSIRLLKKENKLPRNIPKEADLNKFLKTLKEFWKYSTLNKQKRYYKIHVIAELMYSSGIRIDEVSKLKVTDIDFDRNVVIVRNGKGGKDRIGYLNEYEANILKIFINEMGESLTRDERIDSLFGFKDVKALESFLNKNLTKIGELTGIGRFTSHNFRHCLGFHLLRRGSDMRYIQLILGHDDLKSTAVYTKVDKKDLKNELDKYHPRRFGNKENG